MFINIILNVFRKPYYDENTVLLWTCKIGLLCTLKNSLGIVTIAAYTVTIMKGTDFQKSVKEVCSKILKKPTKFLLFNIVSLHSLLCNHYVKM